MSRLCTACGYLYNKDGSDCCEICGANLHGNESIIAVGDIIDDSSCEVAHDIIPLAENSSDFVHSPTEEAQEISETGGFAPPVISGRINNIERHEERPHPDIYRTLSRILIGILIAVPFAVLFVITGIISFSFAVLGLRTLSNMFNPLLWATSLFELLEIFVLARIRGTDTVPIYRGTLESRSGQEFFFMFRGPLSAGGLVLGHQVEFEGQWRDGTFDVRNGTDLTVTSEIYSTYRNPWRIVFVCLLCVYGLLGVWIVCNLYNV